MNLSVDSIKTLMERVGKFIALGGGGGGVEKSSSVRERQNGLEVKLKYFMMVINLSINVLAL